MVDPTKYESKGSGQNGKITETKSGKINFEKTLQGLLRKAEQTLDKEPNRNNQLKDDTCYQFAKSVWKVWKFSLYKDKKEIVKLLNQWLEMGVTDELSSKEEFLEFVKASPQSSEGFLFGKTYFDTWVEILELMNEGLKRRYYGDKRQWSKSRMDVSED